ncbi:protein translocase subunit SecD [Aliiglaciecola sp. SL4]|uniref:protein translocase subunit SecD n=1 Tax=Aliiglaciecola sp. SL4 TaxID=3239806 RepID=UPI00355C82C9
MRKTTAKSKHTWQLIVIIVTVLILGLNAIPTLYGNNNALLISSSNPTQSLPAPQTLRQLMQQENIQVKQIISGDTDSKIVIQGDDEALSIAQQKLKTDLDDSYEVRLGSQSAAPKWLNELGMSPIKLGLDLSGGVLFVLEVDTPKADQERYESAKDEAMHIIRQQGFRGMSVKLPETNGDTSTANGLNLHFLTQQTSDVKTLVQKVQDYLPGIVYTKIDENNGRLMFSEQSINEFHQQIMAQALTTLRGRIEELGITEAVTQRQGANRIRVELPGVKDPEQAKRIIGATASLDFYAMAKDGEIGAKTFKDNSGRRLRVASKPIFTGSSIENANSGRDEMGGALVNLSLDSVGGEKMSAFSKNNIGNPMVVVFSEYHRNAADEMVKRSRVINVATIQAQLGNRFSITNLDSHDEAAELALLLRAGSLDAPITIVQQRTIQASLGQDNVNNGIMALAIGLSITLLFMGLWYRKLGLIANTCLVLNLVCLVGLMALLPNMVLTLPGIAGLVLTVGMAVDTNVLIFERIKEERKRGRSNFLAIEIGYKEAFRTVLDANITTMITALILLSIGYGPVKGFAMTLSLGILTSMFTGVFVAHVLTYLVKPQIPVKHKELLS